ncbi:unnamed protein product [Ectocarpus sp. CCAP 1310/34]|nr:unnamed protein product [Ectocarpus sp. CCAP 1310/34]
MCRSPRIPGLHTNVLPSPQVFVRGGLLLWVGDGPGRAKVLGSKACNNLSRFPCPYCMVEQRDNITGGDLGDAQYDIEVNRRIWGQITAGFDTLKSLADNPIEQSRQSMVLGLVTDSIAPSLPMYDSMLTAPTAVVPVERLHFDALGSCQLCQVSCLEMLSTQLKGQFLGSAIWSAHLYKDNDVQVDDGSWGARVSGGNFRPDEAALIAQYKDDDVEIFNKPPPTGDHGPPPANQLTLSKIIYFFRQTGNNNSLSGEPPPFTWWVLAYDYVGVGHGNERVPDSITGHPTLSLRGRGRPKVYPVHASRRQVQMYHQCPQGQDAAEGSRLCGETQGAGRDRVWRHKFRLALPGSSNGYDKYLLNKVHHSINQDTFV